MSSTPLSTPGSTLTFAEKVEADKRSILSKALKADLLKVSRLITQYEPMTNKNKSSVRGSVSDDEYTSFFGDDDEDDSDEVFNRVLAEAKAKFLREKELKRKNPFYKNPNEIFKAPPRKRERKRKSKAIQDSIKVMDNFKKNLLLAEKLKPPDATVSTVSTKKTRLSLENSVSMKSVQPEPRMKIYPSWKTTATYTPIFSMPSNPRWTNVKNALDSRNISTPIDSCKQTFTINISRRNKISVGQNSHGSIRSNATTCHSEMGSRSPPISPQTSDHSSTPVQKSTVVHFEPPPHVQSSCSKGESSNSSSGFPQQNEVFMRTNQIHPGNDQNCDETNRIDDFMSPLSSNFNCNDPLRNGINHKNQMNNFPHYYENSHTYNYSDTSDNFNEKTLNMFARNHPVYMDDFTRNLKYHVDQTMGTNQNCKMKVEYSMKLKYFN
ncbi:hypothetical protein QAD02_003919 [Eretmocerus hayati]|uniref:Uncharacterized protein n=1 Tax=Eretmocerus hayati TaxID=131215 RepID=A0ACC2NSZ5_9HYME|nr:hypothetical protein QAD02_003919 [Eretmocerus hayati]